VQRKKYSGVRKAGPPVNRYFTPDVDGHIGGVWKEFDRLGNRIGTLDVYLNRIGK
jgi:hypothetical protein